MTPEDKKSQLIMVKQVQLGFNFLVVEFGYAESVISTEYARQDGLVTSILFRKHLEEKEVSVLATVQFPLLFVSFGWETPHHSGTLSSNELISLRGRDLPAHPSMKDEKTLSNEVIQYYRTLLRDRFADLLSGDLSFVTSEY